MFNSINLRLFSHVYNSKILLKFQK